MLKIDDANRAEGMEYFILTVVRLGTASGPPEEPTYEVHLNEIMHRVAGRDWPEVEHKVQELYEHRPFALIPVGSGSARGVIVLADGDSQPAFVLAHVGGQIIEELRRIEAVLGSGGTDAAEEDWPDVIGG